MRISLLFGIVAWAGRSALRTSVSGLAESLSKFQYATSSQTAATHVLPRTPRKSEVATLMTILLFNSISSLRHAVTICARGWDILQDPFHVAEHHARLIPISRQD